MSPKLSLGKNFSVEPFQDQYLNASSEQWLVFDVDFVILLEDEIIMNWRQYLIYSFKCIIGNVFYKRLRYQFALVKTGEELQISSEV